MARFKLKGDPRTSKIWVNGKELNLEKSLKLKCHSPTGFSWGYDGSGPKQLSLAILLVFYSKEIALSEYLDFLNKEISKIPFGEPFEKNISY
ncbi:DUF6166 domain-containing protein [Aquimarina macrocephali]|uniref:DUF6166 domain-containing protein n=1 Tax=Aquimarina macrocephali TaxID=666563 RepID=UPI003F67698D